MKKILVVFIVLMTFVYADKMKYASSQIQRIEAARRECAKEEKVHVKYLKRLDDIKDLPNRETLKCLSLCVTKKLNLLDAQSRLSFVKLKQLLDDPLLIAKVSTSFTKCQFYKRQMKTCEDGYNIHNCFLANLGLR